MTTKTTTQSTTNHTIDHLQKIVYELLCQLSSEPSTSREDRHLENNTKILIGHLSNIVEKRIDQLSTETDEGMFEDEWVVLVWCILNVLSRIPADVENESIQTLNHLLVALVNRAKPIRIPQLSPDGEKFWPMFHQFFNQTLHLMHDLYSQLDNPNANIDSKLISFCDRQLQPCLDSFRQMCLHHAAAMHTRLRTTQVDRMCDLTKLEEDDFQDVGKHYTSALYILGLLAARLQGFRYECSVNHSFYMAEPVSMSRMLNMVFVSYEQLTNDALLSVEPSTSSILVTNNLFTFGCNTLSKTLIFKQFDVQIVSEDTAVSVQEEIINVRHGHRSATSTFLFPSAALLAMKPTSGVKRNNATANATGGGNTAHKKSDVNSKESVCLQPSYSEKNHSWQAQYPHLLCTTRQKDTVLLDSKSGQIGKRPLFYFYTRAKAFSPTGDFFYVRTLSLPFTIATRRNQDCQVQRMMSSYTATCFWLYGTCSIDGLLLNWNETPLPWSRFKKICSQYCTVNADVERAIEESDFDLLAQKMQCEDCEDIIHGTAGEGVKNGSATNMISFKHMLCPHLRFETDTMSMRFSVWRGILEVLQIFQEHKSNAKQLWDDYMMHGFLDTNATVNLLLPHSNCMVVRLTYILGGSICVSYRSVNSEVIHLEPIELKKLQTKSVLEYLADIAESAKIDYILTARMAIMTVSELLGKYKTGEEVKRIRGVTSNVSHIGTTDQLNVVKFTPLRVAVVACRDIQPPPPVSVDSYHNSPMTASRNGNQNNCVALRRGVGGPQQQNNHTPQVSFEVQLESLMKMYGKTPNEVCDMFSYIPMPQHQPDFLHQSQHQYLQDQRNNYEYC